MPPRRTSSKLHGVSTDLEEKVGRRLLLWEPIISKQLFYYQGIFAAGPTQTTCPGAGRKAGGTGMSLWAPVTPAHTPSGPRPNLPELYTPDQTLPCRPSQRGKWAETSNIAERGLLFPAESRLPPLAEGQGPGSC